MYGLNPREIKILRKLSTPAKIQDFLETLAINFELGGETVMSPRRVLRERHAHCIEGALLAAVALRLQGQKPLLMDLKSVRGKEDDHVIALYRQYGCWGAISKTNHGVLRFREPIYRTIRELALSHFHEWLSPDGKKTLRSFSLPFDVRRYDKRDWVISEKNLFYIAHDLDAVRHYPVLPKQAIKKLRQADPIERAIGNITEWDNRGNQRLFKKRLI